MELNYFWFILGAVKRFENLFCFLSQTVPSLIFAMYCLAKNPDAQQKVYEEIRGVLNADEPITGEHINRLTYLKACVKESQRWVYIQLLAPICLCLTFSVCSLLYMFICCVTIYYSRETRLIWQTLGEKFCVWIDSVSNYTVVKT